MAFHFSAQNCQQAEIGRRWRKGKISSGSSLGGCKRGKEEEGGRSGLLGAGIGKPRVHLATSTAVVVLIINVEVALGEKRTMVFYKGKAPKGRKTHWKIHEYKAFVNPQHQQQQQQQSLQLRHEYSLIRLYKKSRCLRSLDRRPVGIFQLQPISTTSTTASTSTAHSHTNNQLLLNITTPPADQQADRNDDDAAAANHRDREPSGFWGYLQELDLHFNGDDNL